MHGCVSCASSVSYGHGHHARPMPSCTRSPGDDAERSRAGERRKLAEHQQFRAWHASSHAGQCACNCRSPRTRWGRVHPGWCALKAVVGMICGLILSVYSTSLSPAVAGIWCERNAHNLKLAIDGARRLGQSLPPSADAYLARTKLGLFTESECYSSLSRGSRTFIDDLRNSGVPAPDIHSTTAGNCEKLGKISEPDVWLPIADLARWGFFSQQECRWFLLVLMR